MMFNNQCICSVLDQSVESGIASQVSQDLCSLQSIPGTTFVVLRLAFSTS